MFRKIKKLRDENQKLKVENEKLKKVNAQQIRLIYSLSETIEELSKGYEPNAK